MIRMTTVMISIDDDADEDESSVMLMRQPPFPCAFSEGSADIYSNVHIPSLSFAQTRT